MQKPKKKKDQTDRRKGFCNRTGGEGQYGGACSLWNKKKIPPAEKMIHLTPDIPPTIKNRHHVLHKETT
jgi:hypothetical protein